MNRLAVVIPAYRPSPGLVDLVRALSGRQLLAILIVDDGSGPEFRDVFSRAAAFPKVTVLRHAVNLGKGSALKTGFNHALCEYPELAGVITADADGQHHPEDILQIAKALDTQPGSLILGVRSFGKDVPLRSRFGNVATRGVMHALLGQKFRDTQTGLRGIGASLLPKLLRVESTGYEFELQMLIAAHQLQIPTVEVPIRTIYEEGNKSSHFNPIVDSMKIYFVLLRFGSVSVLTALLDNLVFYLTWRLTAHVLASQIVGRVFAMAFNYTMVRSSVFYTRQRHLAVLPKYLALVAVSGSVSYAGIQYMNQALGINPVSAKLLMETVLFFVNFAVQRLVIFKPQESRNGAPRERSAPLLFPGLVLLVFTALFALEIYGFANNHLFAPDIWMPVGWRRFLRFTGGYLTLAVPLLAMAPWSFTGLVIALMVILTAISAGPAAVLASAFFLISSCALGSRLLGRYRQETVESHLLATVLGAALYAFLMTFVARLPVNYPVVWGAVLAIPVLTDLAGVRRRLSQWTALVRTAELRGGWERTAFGVFAFFVMAHWMVTLKPEVGTDALAVHLAVPMNVATYHAMTFQPARYFWSVMPMAADWQYTIVYLLGGEFASRLLNFAMLLIVLGVLYGTMRRFVPPATAWFLAATFAATPLVQLVTGSMYTDNFLAALLVGMMLAIWLFGETGVKVYLFAAMLAGGAAMNIKLGALVFVTLALPFVGFEVVRHWKKMGPRAWAACALALVLLVVTASIPYVMAYWKTGNPVFPFLAQKFRSPLIDPPEDFQDLRFAEPVNWSLLYGLTFHTSRSYEGQDGSFGFQYLVAAPLVLLALLMIVKRPATSAAVVSLAAAVIILRLQPNLRYLYVSMALLTVPLAALLGWLLANQRWLYQVFVIFLVAATAMNAYFMPASGWYNKDFSMRLPFSHAEHEKYLREAAPIRSVIEYYNQHHPQDPVLTTGEESEVAGLEGMVYENNWHQWPTVAKLRQAFSPRDMLALMQQWHVQYFIAHRRSPTPGDVTHPQSLQTLLDTCTVQEYAVGDRYLGRLVPDCEQRLISMTPPERPLEAVGRGRYDDFDSRVRYRGDWAHDESFPETDRQTVSYNNIPGADITLAFNGTAVTYVYTKAFNRGQAEITIDGSPAGTIDLYSPKTEWQAKTRFCCYAPGPHVLVIRVTGQGNPAATSRFVDLDSLIIE